MGEIADNFDDVYRDFVIEGLPSSGLYEPEKARLRALGSIIEEALGGELTPYVDAASLAAANANASALTSLLASAAQSVLPSVPAALPYQVTQITGGIGTGSGGTPGWYVGGVSGGPSGFQWSYQIGSDGKLAQTRIDNPGISTSNTAPVLSLPSGGMTGATIPTATVSTIPVNRAFSAISSDNLSLTFWQNAAGALTPVNKPDGKQLQIPLRAYFDALLASLSSVTSSGTVGPTGTLINGSNIDTKPQFFLDLVPSTASVLTSIDIYDKGAGTVEFANYRNISGTVTLQGSGTITLTGANMQVTKPLSAALSLMPGDVLAIRALTAGIYTFTSAIAGSGVYVNPTAGAFPSTIALGSMTAGVQPQVRFNFAGTTQTVTATSFAALSALVNGMASTVSSNAIAVALLQTTTSAGTVGPTGTLINGSNITTAPQYFLDAVPTGANTLATVDIFDKAAGTVEFANYRTVAGTVTLQGKGTITLTGANAPVTKPLSTALSLLPGDIIAVRALTAGIYTFTSAIAGSGVFVGTAGSFPATITLGSMTAGVQPQVRLNFTNVSQPVTGAAFAALAASVAAQAASIADNSAVSANLKARRTGSGSLGQTAALVTGTGITNQPQYFLDPVPSGCNKAVTVNVFDRAAGQMEIAFYRGSPSSLNILATQIINLTGANAEVVKQLSPQIDVLPGDTYAVRAVSAGVYPFTSGSVGSGVYVSAAGGPFPATVALGAKAPNVVPQVRVNFDTVSQPVTTASVATLQSKVLARPVIDPLDYPARYTTNTGWNGFLSYGQSNSDGVNAQSALSTSQPYSNLTFGSGVRAGRSGNSWGAVNTSPGTSTSKALIEENASGGTPAADGATNSGETIITGATSTACELACINEGYDPNQIVWFGSAPGHTGYAIAQLQRGSAWYSNLLSHVTDALALATAAGKAYKVSAVGYIQGENDASASTSYAAYKAALAQLSLDFDRDIRAITGQSEPVHTLVWQIAGSNGGASLSTVADIRRAQFDAVDGAVRLLHMVGPMYPYPGQSSDQIHMLNSSQLRMGRITGRALYQLVMQRIKPDVIWPLMAYARGTQLRIKFRIPKAPLVLDPALLGTVTDSGFKVTDGTGTLTLSNVRVSTAGDEIVIDLNRSLGSSPVVRYALDYASSTTNLTLCAGGTVRDSTIDSTVIGGTTYSLAHICPGFQKSVYVLDAQG